MHIINEEEKKEALCSTRSWREKKIEEKKQKISTSKIQIIKNE